MKLMHILRSQIITAMEKVIVMLPGREKPARRPKRVALLRAKSQNSFAPKNPSQGKKKPSIKRKGPR